jgi:glycosyltransferase involved in cell wall biosynthesis
VRLDVSVIVPAFRAAAMLRQTLSVLVAAKLERRRWELIVVDDGSDDDTAAVAELYADRVVRLPSPPGGPAGARNRGAEASSGEIFVFVDADVALSSDALAHFVERFAADPSLGAVFGAYDARPPANGLVSQYRNLMHHYVHVTNAGPAATFWAGCGAVRRLAFNQCGGFDSERYRRPQIEDIELGHRLRDRGWSILLDPQIQGTHLKRWTLAGGLLTDVRDRGVPWVRLLLRGRQSRERASALNLRGFEKAMTLLVAMAAVCLVLGAVRSSPRWLAAAAAAVAVVLVGNVPVLRWLAARRGWLFALRAIPLRLLSYAVNVVSVLIGTGAHVLNRLSHGSRDRELAAPPTVGLRS